jgi:hypothetical protein
VGHRLRLPHDPDSFRNLRVATDYLLYGGA